MSSGVSLAIESKSKVTGQSALEHHTLTSTFVELSVERGKRFSRRSLTSEVPVTEKTILGHLQDALSKNMHHSELPVCIFETWKHYECAQHPLTLKYVTTGIKANAEFTRKT